MSLTLEKKQQIVSEVAAVAGRAPLAVAAEYAGLNVAEMTRLRRSARKANVYLRVVRNTLARRALEGSQFDCMRSGLAGPLVLAFSAEEPGSAAQVIRDFARDNDQLIVRLVAMDGRLLAPEDINRLAALPSLEGARALLLGLVQAPLAKFARLLAEPEASFVRLLAAKRDQLGED